MGRFPLGFRFLQRGLRHSRLHRPGGEHDPFPERPDRTADAVRVDRGGRFGLPGLAGDLGEAAFPEAQRVCPAGAGGDPGADPDRMGRDLPAGVEQS